MQSSLVPERPLIVSPTLAATIGLEEAVMLHVFSELLAHRDTLSKDGLRWVMLDQDELCKAMPFWAWIDIKRVQKNLLDLGLILVDPDASDPQRYRYAINQGQGRANVTATQHPGSGSPLQAAAGPAGQSATGSGASYIPANWQPSDDCIRLCRQHGISEEFVRGQVPGFVMYWRERRQSRFSWGNAFHKHVIREWRQEQTRRHASQLDRPMSEQWWPDEEALSILENSGVNRTFIEDSVPEFVLYWRERGAVEGAWNSRFIEHIRRQWARYNATMEHDGQPRPIPENWQPDAACYEILRLAEIDEDYARSKVAEFVLYWRDTRQVQASWNSRFLQYIKFNWAKRLEGLQDVSTGHAKNKSPAGGGGQSLEASFRRITDRSWAE